MIAPGASVAVFIAQLVVLLLCSRLIGELLQRIGQPAVMGQIIGGVLLGPSVLGTLTPQLSHLLFPDVPQQRAMLDAVSQLGILLLLLITGMEIDLSVFRHARRAAVSVSLSGIALTFVGGFLLGALLPESMLPQSGRRLITALFLGIALSISSVKILSLVVRDLGFLRRTIGQVIVGAAVLDDTVGWIAMSITFGLALHGSIDIAAVAHTVLGTALFLVLSIFFGRRLIFMILRWSNDVLSSEMANITTIVVVTGVLALVTNALGVHLVLGAFIAGVLFGQSPMLTKQLNGQLRGLIMGLFMPIFFATVGLTIDLGSVAQGRYLWLMLVLIAIASLGKFLGAFLGGRIGGLTRAESLVVGCGMNARGSTEVIVASIGLQLGALNLPLFTAIVAMAVVTTLAMPPMLRWAYARVPMTDEERARLEREAFEARGFVARIERLLVAVDASASGRLASSLAGLLASTRRAPTTVVQLDAAQAEVPGEGEGKRAERSGAVVTAAATAGAEAVAESGAAPAATGGKEPIDLTTRAAGHDSAISTEAEKGYGLMLIGCEPTVSGEGFAPQISRTVRHFGGAFAIAIARALVRRPAAAPLRILVTASGTQVSRQGAEIAIALAHASQGSVTALHVTTPRRSGRVWGMRVGQALAPRGYSEAVIREIIEMGEHYGIEVRGEIRQAGSVRNAVLRELGRATHDLLVMGVSPRPGEQLFLGELAAEIVARSERSILFVCGEPAPGAEAEIA